ncbi:hypothetical protein ACIA6E_11670 [Streptomyces sp. NPDC051815]|uniref:hypothetical protein n=1 Tax=Streptomyces sp. NPDC051815 TaxID=3365674 RepID=UPI003794BA0A
MLIEGYATGPVTPGEPLLGRPGFWWNHLSVLCGDGACGEQPVPEWFGEDGADADALSEVLFDPAHWPAFRVSCEDGSGAVVVHRNLVGDYGIDYLLVPPGGRRARHIAHWEGDFSGTGLTWRELVGITDGAPSAAEGVRDADARFLLLLPLLDDPRMPCSAPERLTTSLTAAGAPQDTVRRAAEHLWGHLGRRSRHDPSWASPLSGGSGPGSR